MPIDKRTQVDRGRYVLPLLLVFGILPLAAQTPTVSAVTDASIYGANLCPGMIAVIFGANFGSSGPAVSVTVGGKKGYVSAVTPAQISVEIPMEASAGATSLVVTVGTVSSAPFNITLNTYAPVFLIPGGAGTGAAAIYDSKGNQITASNPATPGESLTGYALGLGPTNPVTPTGPAAATNPTASTATLTVGGAAATVQFAGIPAGYTGVYQLTFVLPKSIQGDEPMVLSIGGVSSPPQTLSLFGITSIENNASFGSSGVISPGEIATIYANGIGSANITSGFPSTNFQGISVTIDGRAAPLFHVNGSVNSIDLLVPQELPTSGTVTVQLTTPTGTSLNFDATAAAATPGLYRLADPSTTGRYNIIAQFAGTVWLALPVSEATAYGLPSNCGVSITNPLTPCGGPAAPGDYLAIYVTGLGVTTPNGDPNGTPLATGAVAPVDGSILYETPTQPTVTVGGVPAQILFSGVSPGFAGLYLIDIQVPNGVTPGDDVPVVLSMPGSSSDTATVSVQPKS